MDLPRHIALAGPTASGKTAAALAIAEKHPVEIISVDSALVYRGMDIGTAKPTAAELAAVPHHLINIRDPLHAYSAAEFVTDATALMQDITARGKLPLLVGGTMLYSRRCNRVWTTCPRRTQRCAVPLNKRPRNKAGRHYMLSWREWTR